MPNNAPPFRIHLSTSVLGLAETAAARDLTMSRPLAMATPSPTCVAVRTDARHSHHSRDAVGVSRQAPFTCVNGYALKPSYSKLKLLVSASYVILYQPLRFKERLAGSLVQ